MFKKKITNKRFIFGLNVQQLLLLLLWNDFHFETIFQIETKLNQFGNLWLLLLLPPKG